MAGMPLNSRNILEVIVGCWSSASAMLFWSIAVIVAVDIVVAVSTCILLSKRERRVDGVDSVASIDVDVDVDDDDIHNFDVYGRVEIFLDVAHSRLLTFSIL